MWSRKPQPVAISPLPVPSRFRERVISVSAVLRAISAVRMAYPSFKMARTVSRKRSICSREPMVTRT